MSPRRPVVLIGMMGVGKSTVGRLLAAAEGRDFVDTDAVVEAQAKAKIADIFACRGEAAFREMESTVLAAFLTGGFSGVMSAGGGIVLSPTNRALIRSYGRGVYLQASVVEIARRLGGCADGTRPLLENEDSITLRRRLRELLKIRDLLYRETADIIVRQQPGETAAGVMRRVRRLLKRRQNQV